MPRRIRSAPGQLQLLQVEAVVVEPEAQGPAARRVAAQLRLSSALLRAGALPWMGWRELVLAISGHPPSWWLARAGRRWLLQAGLEFHEAAAAAAERAAALLEALEPNAGRGAAMAACRCGAQLELEGRGVAAVVPLVVRTSRPVRVARQLELAGLV